MQKYYKKNKEIIRLEKENHLLRERCQKLETMMKNHFDGSYLKWELERERDYYESCSKFYRATLSLEKDKYYKKLYQVEKNDSLDINELAAVSAKLASQIEENHLLKNELDFYREKIIELDLTEEKLKRTKKEIELLEPKIPKTKRLSKEEKEEIIKLKNSMKENGMHPTAKEIADIIGCSIQTVYNVCKKEKT